MWGDSLAALCAAAQVLRARLFKPGRESPFRNLSVAFIIKGVSFKKTAAQGIFDIKRGINRKGLQII